jgi:hypothetical protein
MSEIKPRIRIERSSPYDGLISATRCAVSKGYTSQAKGDKIISGLQEMSVRRLTKRGSKVTNCYAGD